MRNIENEGKLEKKILTPNHVAAPLLLLLHWLAAPAVSELGFPLEVVPGPVLPNLANNTWGIRPSWVCTSGVPGSGCKRVFFAAFDS